MAYYFTNYVKKISIVDSDLPRLYDFMQSSVPLGCVVWHTHTQVKMNINDVHVIDFYPSLLGGKRSRRKSPPLKWSGPDLSLNCPGPPTHIHIATEITITDLFIFYTVSHY